ncbi:hypothetical protein EAE96_002805 [Botrytis aclada]|nr:hypothetical protein EAE96_002805 [Botrytis aclada]
MRARQPGPVGGVRDARFGVDARPKRGGIQGLEYPGHLPSQGRGETPTGRGYFGKKFLTPEERRARALQWGNQTDRQGGQSRLSGLPALRFAVQGVPQGPVQPAQVQGDQALPARTAPSTFGAQDTPHQDSGNPGGAPSQQ